jgi:hypothetical protein
MKQVILDTNHEKLVCYGSVKCCRMAHSASKLKWWMRYGMWNVRGLNKCLLFGPESGI